MDVNELEQKSKMVTERARKMTKDQDSSWIDGWELGLDLYCH